VKGRVIIAGFATRHVVESAFRAGYEVLAVDYFCDQDLHWYTKECHTFEEIAEIPDLIESVAATKPVDHLILTSGVEDLQVTLPVSGTPPETAHRFLDKLVMQEFFLHAGLPVPPLCKDHDFPAFIKPLRGAGGWRNQLVQNAAEEEAWNQLWDEPVPYLRQQPVDGIPCSVSCVADGTRARALAVNAQLLRGGEGEKAFGFSGSVTPFDTDQSAALIKIAEQAAGWSGCIGSVGVDLMLDGDTIHIIEINPRFQATVDTVERATKTSVFEHHMAACAGNLPMETPMPKQVAIRSVLFADRDLTVGDDLKKMAPSIADIPWPGTEIQEGSAVLSVYGTGPDRDAAFAKLDTTISLVRRSIDRW